MRKIVLSVFLGTVLALFLMNHFQVSSTVRFFFGAFGFGSAAILMIVLPLLMTYKDEP